MLWWTGLYFLQSELSPVVQVKFLSNTGLHVQNCIPSSHTCSFSQLGSVIIKTETRRKINQTQLPAGCFDHSPPFKVTGRLKVYVASTLL